MPLLFRIFSPRTVLSAAAVAVLLAGGSACSRKIEPEKRVAAYPALPAKNVPAYLRDTVFEKTDLHNTEPWVVSSYGLVSGLRRTGDNGNTPTAIRDWMIKELARHGFGQHHVPGYAMITPEEILKSSGYSIVKVEGPIPPGARKGQRFDVRVSVLEDSWTTSLASGVLYQADLRVRGANPMNPGGSVNVYARAQGPIFVNPSYVTAPGRGTERSGMVMDGGFATTDRPLMLRLRLPEKRMVRLIEGRINQRFQQNKHNPTDRVAAAKDEGTLFVYVPTDYNGDWEHFAGVVQHLYLNPTREFAALKARELAAEAVKPEAPLLNISYAWEGLGADALPYITPLMTHASPDVAFAAARAAAFIGDPAAPQALYAMAATSGHPFQITATQTLGKLPRSPAISTLVRRLLNVRETLVRIEAYKVLVAARDPAVFTRVVTARNEYGKSEKFVLDIAASDGAPVVHATRSGIPRIAVIGGRTMLRQPMSFLAMNNTFSIATAPDGRTVTLYYRGPDAPKPVSVRSTPDVAEIIARLGGEGPIGEPRLDLTYSDVVGIVQALADQGQIVGERAGEPVPVAFMLQDVQGSGEEIYDVPSVAYDPAGNPLEASGDGLPDLKPDPQGQAVAPMGETMSRPQ